MTPQRGAGEAEPAIAADRAGMAPFRGITPTRPARRLNFGVRPGQRFVHMANYVAHYTKKREIMRRREDALRRLVRRGAGAPELARAAEEVRAARIRTCEARLATIPPTDGPGAAQAARIAAEIAAHRVEPVEAILEEFSA